MPKEVLDKNSKLKKRNASFGIDLFPLFPPKINLSKPIDYKKNILNIFIVPGSAGYDFLQNVLEKLNNIFDKIEINLIGPKLYGYSIPNFIEIDGKDGLYSYFYYADLVICAAGNSMIEALYLESKLIVFSTNQNQLTLINYFKERNLLKHITKSNEITRELIIRNSYNDHQEKSEFLEMKFSYDRLINIILEKFY